jgi:hypothetical protein
MKENISIPIILITLFVVIPPCLAQEEDFAKPAVEQATTSANQQDQQYDEATEQAIKQSQEKIEYTSANLRDPFTLSLPQETVVVETGPLPGFKIEGYVWGSSIPQAIIEGTVYSEGDMVKGAKIVKIDKTGITLLYNGNKYIVK